MMFFAKYTCIYSIYIMLPAVCMMFFAKYTYDVLCKVYVYTKYTCIYSMYIMLPAVSEMA